MLSHPIGVHFFFKVSALAPTTVVWFKALIEEMVECPELIAPFGFIVRDYQNVK